MRGSIQRGALFLAVEGQNEALPVVTRSLRVALSSPRTDIRLSEYSRGGHLSSSIGIYGNVSLPDSACIPSSPLRTALLPFQSYSPMSEGGTKTASQP